VSGAGVIRTSPVNFRELLNQLALKPARLEKARSGVSKDGLRWRPMLRDGR
jgi:hypothetical protein